jgi:hypothetical protein
MNRRGGAAHGRFRIRPHAAFQGIVTSFTADNPLTPSFVT